MVYGNNDSMWANGLYGMPANQQNAGTGQYGMPVNQQNMVNAPQVNGYQNQQFQNQQQQYATQYQTREIQNGGFFLVNNIDVAKNYPVAPGNSVTFKDENAPYVYTKTRTFSQFDKPIFEKYLLVKQDVEEEKPEQEKVEEQEVKYMTVDEISTIVKALNEEITKLKNDISKLSKNHSSKPNQKKERQ